MSERDDLLAIMRAFNSDEGLPEEARGTLWRRIVAYPAWQIPVTEQDHALIWTINGVRYMAAQLDASDLADTPKWLERRGRFIVRNIPQDVDGVVFDLRTPHAVGITQADHGEILEHWARVIDAEKALALPSPYDAERFLKHKWLVLGADGCASVTWMGDYRVVNAFTEHEALNFYRERDPSVDAMDVYGIPGADLFAQLATRDDFDGVAVNRLHNAWEMLSPNFVHHIRDSVDTRPNSGAILKARSIAEIHGFLDQREMSRPREHSMTYRDDGVLVARYSGDCADRVALYLEESTTRVRETYDFEPVTPQADPLGFAAEASEILCAGLIFGAIKKFVAQLPATRAEFNADQRPYAEYVLRWVGELEKMIPADLEALPRTELRSADGARILREFGEPVTRHLLGQIRLVLNSLLAG